MTGVFTLAHLSDVHLGPLPAIGPRYWNLKRSLGYINWHRNRRHAYHRDVLDRLVADMLAHTPDQIAVTGDLANLGLPQEHVAAHAWLRSVGPPTLVSAIPGNHDIYAQTWFRKPLGELPWHEYMTSNAEGARFVAGADEHTFPYVRRFGGIAIVGVNSAVPTAPFIAAGEVGAAQRERLAAVLDALGRDGLCRVVLIHHPPLPGQASRSRGLRDAAEVTAVLDAHGAELVLHGHNHLSMLSYRDWRAGAVPVVGVPAASLGIVHPHEPLGRYHLYKIVLHPDGHARIEMIARGLGEPGGPVVEIGRRILQHPGTHEPRSTRP